MTRSARHQLVNFRIIDVFHPDSSQLLRELHGEDLLQGVVIDVSPGASPAEKYAVVQVDGLAAPVVVSVDRVMDVQ